MNLSAHPQWRRPRIAWTLAVWLLLVVATGFFLLFGLAQEDKPWTPLSLEAPVGRATSLKLARLNGDASACSAALATARGLRVRQSASGTAACPLPHAVTIEQSGLIYGRELAASCELAAALYVWEREVVAPAATRHLRSAVSRVDTAGTFACRNVYGRKAGRLSEHASANAIDVVGFRLVDGRRVTVMKDWGRNTAGGKFLEEVRDKSCPLFGAVLGPDYNAAHHDHLHLDRSRFRICS